MCVTGVNPIAVDCPSDNGGGGAGESALEQRHYEVAAGRQYRPAMSKAVMEIRKRSKKALMQLQVLHWGKLSRQLQGVVIMGTTVSS